MSALDITPLKQTGKRLEKKVSELVDDTQAYIITPIPSSLHMTQKQYLSLLGINALENTHTYSEITDTLKLSKRMFFKTAKGYVLEVEIKEGVDA